VGAPCHPLNGVSGRPLRTATPAHPPTADARRNDPLPPLPGSTRRGAPPPPPQAALVRAPATDAGWLGGHPPSDGTERGSPSRGDRSGSSTPSASSQGAPIAVAQRPAQSRPSRRRSRRPLPPSRHDLPPRGPPGRANAGTPHPARQPPPSQIAL